VPTTHRSPSENPTHPNPRALRSGIVQWSALKAATLGSVTLPRWGIGDRAYDRVGDRHLRAHHRGRYRYRYRSAARTTGSQPAPRVGDRHLREGIAESSGGRHSKPQPRWGWGRWVGRPTQGSGASAATLGSIPLPRWGIGDRAYDRVGDRHLRAHHRGRGRYRYRYRSAARTTGSQPAPRVRDRHLREGIAESSSGRHSRPQPRWGWGGGGDAQPRVAARTPQPWALLHCPVGASETGRTMGRERVRWCGDGSDLRSARCRCRCQWPRGSGVTVVVVERSVPSQAVERTPFSPPRQRVHHRRPVITVSR
jgi:hypothetical protein